MRALRTWLVCGWAALLVAGCDRQGLGGPGPGQIAHPESPSTNAQSVGHIGASPATGELRIQEVFARPLSQDAAYEQFRGRLVSAVLHRRYLTWVADGGITVNLNVPKKPNRYEHEGEAVEIEARGKIVEILFKEKHLTLECESENVHVLAAE